MIAFGVGRTLISGFQVFLHKRSSGIHNATLFFLIALEIGSGLEYTTQSASGWSVVVGYVFVVMGPWLH